jgi:DNA modification methylase
VSESFLDGKVTLLRGDCLELLPTLEECSVDSCVTDPPYGIGFMGREWDTFSPEKVAKRVESKRRKAKPDDGSKRGELRAGITYDRSLEGNNRFQSWCLTWAKECFRVLKPGAHILVFSSPRTYHRMACAIEDAGFEIRDQIGADIVKRMGLCLAGPDERRAASVKQVGVDDLPMFAGL